MAKAAALGTTVVVADLQTLLDPLAAMQDAHAVAQVHRTLYVTPTAFYARNTYAAMDVHHTLGLPAFAIDAEMLPSLLRTLTPTSRLTLRLDGAFLNWQSDQSKGRFATQPMEDITPLPEAPDTGVECSKQLVETLQLGALSCQNPALATLGMAGMSVFVHDRRLWCASSDNITIALASLPWDAPSACPTPITIGARALTGQGGRMGIVPLLASMPGRLQFGPQQIDFAGGPYRARIALMPPLSHDVWKAAAPFLTNHVIAPLNKERLAAFTRRTGTITESKVRWTVAVAISNNRITLKFAENLAEAEESYFVAMIGTAPEGEVRIDGRRIGSATGLSKALQAVDELILDHVDKKLLVFRASKGGFTYLISGRS